MEINKTQVKKYGIIALAILLVIIIFQNTEPVSLEILFWRITMSRILLYPLIFLIGLGVGWYGFGKRNKKF
ncbi:DUF1049 domain-containing protein [PVC group bacterium]|nr:DUF1049 domain-containing protein [PVC group bacterium]